MKIPEAAVALCKCTSRHKLFGMRFQKVESNLWDLTWAFEMQEKAAKNEGYDTTVIKGGVRMLDEYPGCPYCGNRGVFVCSCGKLNCLEKNVPHGKTVRCEWCGNEGNLGEYDGNGIKSGGDR